MIGEKFNNFTVISLDHTKQIYKPNGRSNGLRKYFLCKCDCGNYSVVRKDDLKSLKFKNCNHCNKKGKKNSCYKHGEVKTRLYKIWGDMRNRCNNPNNSAYIYYGGRNIKVCQEWSDFLNFKEWALQNKYKNNLTIDRIDVNGNYDPNNCRWVSKREQNLNKRNNHYITYNGETHTMKEWAEIKNINYLCLSRRLNGLKWDIERALTTTAN
jgi:hypothetical protein